MTCLRLWIIFEPRGFTTTTKPEPRMCEARPSHQALLAPPGSETLPPTRHRTEPILSAPSPLLLPLPSRGLALLLHAGCHPASFCLPHGHPPSSEVRPTVALCVELPRALPEEFTAPPALCHLHSTLGSLSQARISQHCFSL